MSQDIKNVIVIGAGGNLGPSVLQALDSDPHFTVAILSRHESTSIFPSHFKVHKTDYSPSSLHAAFEGQDAIVSTISPTGNLQQKSIIDAAIKAGVKRFVPAEFGSNTANAKAVELVPIFKGKEEVTNYLKSKESEGLSWTAIVNGPFFDWGLQVGFLGFDLHNHTATVFDSGDHKWSTTTVPTIGRAVSSVLRHPDQTKNKYVYIASFTTSQNEVLHSLEKASGRKWEVKKTTTDEQVKEGQEKLARGDYSGILPLILAATYGGGRGSDFEEDEGLSNELLSLPREDLDEVVSEVVKGENV